MAKKSYKFRFYPTDTQIKHLSKVFGHTRFVYNWMLRTRQDIWIEHKERIDYHDSSFLLTNLKKQEDFIWLTDVSAIPLQQSLRHLQTAFSNFFAGRSKHPVFKKKYGKQSAEYTTSAFSYKEKNLVLSKVGKLKVRWSRPFFNAPSTVTISKDSADRYFVSLVVEENIRPFRFNAKTIGIDLGIKDVIVTSDGWKSGNPVYTKKYEKKLAKAQKNLAKKKMGSNNRKKAKLKVAKIHAKISDSRKDFLHKLSTKLIRENQTISVETLAVKNMVKNHNLAKAIYDSGWGELLRQLQYKSEWYSRTLVGIDRWYPSTKRCSSCGHVIAKISLDVRTWVCPECKTEHDRDINAAINVKAAGLAVLACGENVSRIDSISMCCSR